MRRRLWVLLALAPLLCGSSWEVTGSLDLSGSWESGSFGSSFVALADSDLSGISSRVPTVYTPDPVDTSGWTGYDVTCESSDGGCTAEAGMTKFPASWGCDPMVGNGSTDDGPALQCQFAALGNSEYLYVPDGTGDYVLDTLDPSGPDADIAIIPDSSDDQQGIICESQSAVLSSRAGDDDVATSDVLRIVRTVGDSFPGSNTWTITAGDVTAGSTGPFTTSASHTLTAGDWVVFSATRQDPQQTDDQVWATKVVTTPAANTFTVEHALPDDLNSAADGASEWDPQENFVIRNCTLEFEDGTHVFRSQDDLIQLVGCAECEVSGVQLRNGYQHFIVTGSSADLLIQHSDMRDPKWDKGPNGYGVRLGSTSRIWLHNNAIQHQQPIAVGAQTKAANITFNALIAPDRGCTDTDFDGFCDSDGTTPTYDMDCSNNGGNCEFTGLALHNTHGTTVGATGYMHCSGDEDDAAGNGGNSGGCNGTPATGAYGCVEWHNGAGSQGLFMRNHCEASSAWIDFFEGPGRDNFNFGNWVGASADKDVIPFSRGKGNFTIVAGEAAPSGYRRNDTWANNLFEGDVDRFDDGGDGVQFLDNVIAGSCQYANFGALPSTDPTGGDCSSDSTSLGHVPTNSVWSNNTVGQDTHAGGYSRTMPSLPGFTDWPDFDGDDAGLTAPYVGPEMGDPDTYTGCLPAYKRWNGGSC